MKINFGIFFFKILKCRVLLQQKFNMFSCDSSRRENAQFGGNLNQLSPVWNILHLFEHFTLAKLNPHTHTWKRNDTQFQSDRDNVQKLALEHWNMRYLNFGNLHHIVTWNIEHWNTRTLEHWNIMIPIGLHCVQRLSIFAFEHLLASTFVFQTMSSTDDKTRK